jgi:hypothetical protein
VKAFWAGVRTALGKFGIFLLAGVVGTLVVGALSAVHDDRVAAREARENLVRELTEQVSGLGTSRLIALGDLAPSAYLYDRCGRDLRRTFQGSGSVEEACDKAGVDALLEEQKLGNEQRDAEARLLVLAEVARGEYDGEGPSAAIEKVHAATRALRRLGSSNPPFIRRELVGDLRRAGVPVSAGNGAVLIHALFQRDEGVYDVNGDAMFAAYEDVSGQADVLTGHAVEELRTAELKDRSTTYHEAVGDVASDPFIIIAGLFGVLLVLAFRPWEKAEN